MGSRRLEKGGKDSESALGLFQTTFARKSNARRRIANRSKTTSALGRYNALPRSLMKQSACPPVALAIRVLAGNNRANGYGGPSGGLYRIASKYYYMKHILMRYVRVL